MMHDGMSGTEIQLMKHLYVKGIIRLMVVSWGFSFRLLGVKSHLVIVMDVERYDGAEGRMVEYPMADVLQMEGLANLSLTTRDGSRLAPKCLLMCYTPRRDYFVKFLQEPIPIESDLAENLHDTLNAEVVAGTVTSKQDAVDWLTWSFMYRRLAPNPNFYNLNGRTAQHINDFLSQLVEDTVDDLVATKCIKVDEETEMDIEAVNFGKIAAFYGIKYQTIGQFVA
jgi:pre-mRNA-splicing helicase BRR2